MTQPLKCANIRTAANPTPDLTRRVAGRMIAYHAATPAALCHGSGVLFFVSSACYFRWLAPEVAVNTTVFSSCASVGLRPEVAMPRLLPPHVLAAPPLDAEAIVPTLYDPEDFAALYHTNKARALVLVAAMAEPQRVRQALAYCAWLGYHGLEIDLDTVLAAWEGS